MPNSSTGVASIALDCGIRDLDVTLIRPTNYTDDGYPIRTRIGVIRSNSLSQLTTLTRGLADHPSFQGMTISVRAIDEAIGRVPVRQILDRSNQAGVRSIVMMVGVQSNQFPRALDLAASFLPHGVPVVIGGFHVSGMMAMVGLTSDLREAMSRGIVLVAGEAENGRLATVVEDILRGDPEPLYNFMNTLADLTSVPTAKLSGEEFKRFASPFSTIDTGRGCVFTCDFCTIINVQGRTMRCRDPLQVIDFIRQGYKDAGVSHCFFTDDNLARNPRWRELFDGLIKLREEEGIPFSFMMQSDLAARKIPPGDFFVLAARAGCNQVFFGVESVNKQNLRSQEKFQNQVNEYQSLVDHCHSLGITCHAGYILGLPFDTPASIREDITELQRMGFDSASFYIITPLPGSKDHQTWWRQRRWMDPDFNTYDSAHVAVQPERMTREELMQAYRDTWEQFYSTDYMAKLLTIWRHDRGRYWGKLFFYAWYLYASRIEKLHPMNCGFWTVRRRNERRPGFPIESFAQFWWGRAQNAAHHLREIVRLFFQLEEVWLQSRPKTHIEEVLHDRIARTRQGIADWRDLKARELVALYQKIHDELPEVKVPSVVSMWFRKHNPFARSYSRSYAQRTWREWYRHVWNPLRWAEVWAFECFYGLRFVRHFLQEGR
jgi:hypothetical protein